MYQLGNFICAAVNDQPKECSHATKLLRSTVRNSNEVGK